MHKDAHATARLLKIPIPCSRAAAGPLPGSCRIAGFSPADEPIFFGEVIYEQLRASDSSQTLLVLSLSPHLPFRTGVQPLGRSGH